MNVTLTWHGPWTFEQLLRDSADPDIVEQPGVYVWVERLDGVGTVTYVGKSSRTFRKRQLEHYRCMIGGQYWIPERARRGRGVWNPSLSAEGTVPTLFDLDRFLDVVKDGFSYVQLIHVYFAAATGVPLLQLERNLIARWCPEQNEKVFLRDEERLGIDHHGVRLPPPAR